jgi:hypothetical protein
MGVTRFDMIKNTKTGSLEAECLEHRRSSAQLGWGAVGMTSSADRTAAHSRHRVHAQPMLVDVFMDTEDRPVMAWLPRPIVISYRLTSNPIGRQRCRQPAL